MRFRPHRGCLADSLAEAFELNGRDGLIAHLRLRNFPDFLESKLHIEPQSGDDHKTGWKDVHVIWIEDLGLIGYCEGPC